MLGNSRNPTVSNDWSLWRVNSRCKLKDPCFCDLQNWKFTLFKSISIIRVQGKQIQLVLSPGCALQNFMSEVPFRFSTKLFNAEILIFPGSTSRCLSRRPHRGHLDYVSIVSTPTSIHLRTANQTVHRTLLERGLIRAMPAMRMTVAKETIRPRQQFRAGLSDLSNLDVHMTGPIKIDWTGKSAKDMSIWKLKWEQVIQVQVLKPNKPPWSILVERKAK